MTNGKQKGNSGERELAKIWSEIFGKSFVRIPNSGAYIGGKNQSRKENLSTTQIRASKSDIFPPDDMPKLVIESKSYKDLPFHKLCTTENVQLLDVWIAELEYDCDQNDIGFLCMKFNRKGWYIVFSSSFDLELPENYTKYKHYYICEMLPFLSLNKDRINQLAK